ncbi:MAG: hypothetical protein LLF76_01810 [Planctomycetaceae bacterium]|nr:hypothetical protein [Planctomycetaceae bacterium]
MLEAIFQNIIDSIIRVQNSHKGSSDEKAMLSCDWEFIFRDFQGWLVLHCSTVKQLGGYWIYPMLHPETDVDSLKKQLPNFSFWPPATAYSHVMNNEDHWIEPYWGTCGNFTDSEIPLFFGYPKGKESYYEFNQLITHVLDLHKSANNNSYCRIDDQGDEIEKIKVINHSEVNLILIRRKTLDKLLYLGKWVLVRYCNFSPYKIEHPAFKNCLHSQFESESYDAKYEIRKCDDEYIEFRGGQIERPYTPREDLLSWGVDDEEAIEKEYAEFIVWDWKNKTVLKRYSINPANFADYFTQSDLPFEISPIFFKAEVLDKYKNNPDKYVLSERDISCRGGWHLQTYDINEHNQVHTYAVYLARLPYKEQLHWLQYNEEPKGGISKRAFQTDFEAKWPNEKSKFEQLKESLEALATLRVGKEKHVVWSPKAGSWAAASKGLHYVNSENPNQWHDFIIALNNTVNEGFQIKPLKIIASSFGNTNEELGTIGLIKFILAASGNEDKIPTTHGVLWDLQKRRSEGKAHGSWNTPKGSLINDSNERLLDVINAVERLTEVFSSIRMQT